MPAYSRNAGKVAQRALYDWLSSPSGLGLCILSFFLMVGGWFQYEVGAALCACAPFAPPALGRRRDAWRSGTGWTVGGGREAGGGRARAER